MSKEVSTLGLEIVHKCVSDSWGRPAGAGGRAREASAGSDV
jgi:hypothetical protein